ncbi:MAG TPA: hypothetical protein VGZ50_04120 [Actinomycetota bacterium]|nr:hypothetical protein [Actinomycetota bacterium]
MRTGTARRLAWAAFLLWVLFLVASFALDLATKPFPGAPGPADPLFALIPASFAIVGILILGRQPRNRIGWILMVIGLAWMIPLEPYGGFAYSRDLPGGALFIALSGPTWVPPIGLMGTVLLLRFPDGNLPSPRWKKLEWLAVIAISVTVVVILFGPRDLAEEGYPGLLNPLGIDALEAVLNALMVFLLLIPLTIAASAISLILRFRRSTGMERLQIKWLASAAVAVAAIYLGAILASLNTDWGGPTTPTWIGFLQNASFASFALIPIAIGFAVLRYRLYDIDLVINKTLVYGSLTALLAGIYIGGVVGLGALVRAVTDQRGNSVVIAASTLAVAALFRPARQSIQGFIDRRFYRRKYDAARTLESFSARLRDEVDLDSLAGELVGVVRDTMQPSHVSLWLRRPETQG